MSSSTQQSDLESRVLQLEADVRSATNFQRQVAEASVLVTTNQQKSDTQLETKGTSNRMARWNQELQGLSYQSNESKLGSSDRHLVQQISSLEEQNKRLEQKVEKANEYLTLEKEKNRTIEANLRENEKELSETKIDLRIARLETKTAEAQVAKLEENIKLINYTQLKAKDEEIESLRKESNKLKADLEEAKKSLTRNIKDLEISNEATSAVREYHRELQCLKDELTKIQKSKVSVEVELKEVKERLIRYHEEKSRLLRSLEEEKVKVVEKEANISYLKETIAKMDVQIRDLEAIVQCEDRKEWELDAEKLRLQAEVERMKQELSTARQQVNEERSLKLFTEGRLNEVEARLKTTKAESTAQISSIKQSFRRTEAETIQLKSSLADIENQLLISESTVNKLSLQITILDMEKVQLQEESADLSNQLIGLKDSNAKLSDEHREAVEKCGAFKERILQLESSIEELKTIHKEREHKFEMTLGQQTKLIEFLQAKGEESGKKKNRTPSFKH